MNKTVKKIKLPKKRKNNKQKQPINRSLRITTSLDRLKQKRRVRRLLRFARVTWRHMRALLHPIRTNGRLRLLRAFRVNRRKLKRRVVLARRSTPTRLRRRRGKAPIGLRQRRYVANQTLYLRLSRFLVKHGQPRRLRSRRIRNLYRRLSARREHARPTRLNYWIKRRDVGKRQLRKGALRRVTRRAKRRLLGKQSRVFRKRLDFSKLAYRYVRNKYLSIRAKRKNRKTWGRYGGIMGKLRWRTERRDEYFVGRARRRYMGIAKTIASSSQTVRKLRGARAAVAEQRTRAFRRFFQHSSRHRFAIDGSMSKALEMQQAILVARLSKQRRALKELIASTKKGRRNRAEARNYFSWYRRKYSLQKRARRSLVARAKGAVAPLARLAAAARFTSNRLFRRFDEAQQTRAKNLPLKTLPSSAALFDSNRLRSRRWVFPYGTVTRLEVMEDYLDLVDERAHRAREFAPERTTVPALALSAQEITQRTRSAELRRVLRQLSLQSLLSSRTIEAKAHLSKLATSPRPALRRTRTAHRRTETISALYREKQEQEAQAVTTVRTAFLSNRKYGQLALMRARTFVRSDVKTAALPGAAQGAGVSALASLADAPTSAANSLIGITSLTAHPLIVTERMKRLRRQPRRRTRRRWNVAGRLYRKVGRASNWDAAERYVGGMLPRPKRSKAHRIAEHALLNPVSIETLTATQMLNNESTFNRKLLSAKTVAPSSRTTAADRKLTLFLKARQKRRKEQFFYHNKTLPSLPRTKQTKRALRQMGRGLFARNSLKRPQTLSGVKNLLLPPSKAIEQAALGNTTGFLPTVYDFAQKKQKTIHPRIWVRPARYKSRKFQRVKRRLRTKTINYQALRQYKRRCIRRTRQLRRGTRDVTARLNLITTALKRLAPTRLTNVSTLQVYLQLNNEQLHLQRLTRRRRWNQRARNYSTRQGQVARIAEKRTSVLALKKGAAWHARSVQEMRKVERSLTAWAPRFRTRRRYWASPREGGMPLRRRWLSRRARRERRRLNDLRLREQLPEKRYPRTGQAKLQFYHGNVGSAGYVRFRRVHRGGSSLHNRWWRTIKYPAPFAHPYSRRSLNLVKYRTRHLLAAVPPIAQLRAKLERRRDVHYTRRVPVPRWIPWRNFNYRASRNGKHPEKIRRWTFTAHTGGVMGVRHRPRRTTRVFARTARARRRIEAHFPKANVWKGRRWTLLDTKNAAQLRTAQLEELLARIPASVWGHLQAKTKTAAAYARARTEINHAFNKWAAIFLTKVATGTLDETNRPVALRQLIKIVRNKIAAVTNWNASLNNVNTLDTYQTSKNTAFARRVALKRENFWRARLLPRFQRISDGRILDPLKKTSSALYRRWLHGAERVLRRSQNSYLPTMQSPYEKSQTFSIGRRRTRFPGSGRRKGTYDSLLHAFAKRTSPARFRRVAILRFKRAQYHSSGNFREDLVMTMSDRRLRQRRALARALNRVSYLSPSWRELLNLRALSPLKLPTQPYTDSRSMVQLAAQIKPVLEVGEYFPREYAQPFGSAVKRRFASLPLKTVYKTARKQLLRQQSTRVMQARAFRRSVLRRALRLRRGERRFLDLKKSLRRRRLPVDSRPLPWRARRSQKRCASYRRRDDWSRSALRKRPLKRLVWVLSNVSPRGTRLSNLARVTPKTTPFGEILNRTPRIVRNRRAKRQLSIKGEVRSRARRRPRDSALEKRRRRRFNRRWAQHWSETKDQDVTLGIASTHGRHFVKRALQKYPNKLTRTNTIANIAGGPKTFNVLASLRARLATMSKQFAIQSQNNQLNQLTRQSISSKGLRPFTSLNRRKRLLQIRRAARRLKTRRRFRRAMLHTHETARKRFNTEYMQEQRRLAANSIGTRLVQAAATMNTTPSVSPLLFQKPIRRVLKTEAQKNRIIVANIAAKEEGYKMTAQLVESFTTFVPELINHMISSQIVKGKEKFNYETTRSLIRGIYWSLRVYLNVDPFGVRLSLRDKHFTDLVMIREEIEDAAAFQVTKQPQRAALRRRFANGRLQRAANTHRYRTDWLRRFLPHRFSLYQEDASEFGFFLPSTRRLRRLQQGGRGVASWTSAHSRVSLETRARQILTLRFSKPHKRFETMLQGTRRIPTEELLLDDEMKEVTSVATGYSMYEAPKAHPFFARHFSTAAQRSTAFASRWIQQRKRFVTFEEIDEAELKTEKLERAARGEVGEEERGERVVSPYVLATSRHRIQARLEARGRTNYAAGAGAIAGTMLDGRFLRAKSPRSRQYILRAPKSVMNASEQERLVNIVKWRGLLQRKVVADDLSRAWVRTTRRSVYNQHALTQTNTLSQHLDKERALLPARRGPSFLETRRQLLSTRLWAKQQQLGKPVELIRTNPLLKKVSEIKHRRDHFNSISGANSTALAAALTARLGSKLAIRSKRSVLQYRTAKQRSISFEHRRARIIPAWSIAGNRRMYNRHIQWGNAVRIFTATRWLQQNGMGGDATVLVHARKALGLGKKIGFYRAMEPRRLALRRRCRLLTRGSRGVFDTSARLVTERAKTVRTRAIHRVKRKGHWMARHAKINRRCRQITKQRRQTPFDTFRNKLWNALTRKHMLRRRIMKNWIRDTSRWLRDPWIKPIVDLRRRRRWTDSSGGVLRDIEQQVGEYVADVDETGADIPKELAPRELEPLQVRPQPRDKEVAKTKNLIRNGKIPPVTKHRLAISMQARKKPIPTRWLAEHEFKQVCAKLAEESAKPHKQKVQERAEKLQAEWERKAKKLPKEKPTRDPLKHPSNYWLPHVIWLDIQRRAKAFEWKESDEVFFRKGFRNAFSFSPQERSRAPWLEPLMYNRATFSTRLLEFRRWQFPREQKKYKWLQRVRKALFSARRNKYIRRRRWHQLRTYNQKLFYSLFNLPDRRAAGRHFRKLNKRSQPQISGFVHAQTGLGDRLDVTLMHLKVVPSIFWARVVAPFGILRVNGELQYDSAYRLKPNDHLQLELDKVHRFKQYFKPQLNKRQRLRRGKRPVMGVYPRNISYDRGTRVMTYKHAPDESDLRRSSRLQGSLFRWFKLDSV